MDNFQEDNIRQPDKVIREQLVEDNRSEFEKQIEEATYLSMLEIHEKENINRKYEEDLLKEYSNESNRRKEIFREFLFNINKISKFDNEIKDIYEIIEPIIDLYIGQVIQVCELDKKTYDKIFGTLRKIRNNQVAFDTLKLIILSE